MALGVDLILALAVSVNFTIGLLIISAHMFRRF
jgi:hypothetical protein